MSKIIILLSLLNLSIGFPTCDFPKYRLSDQGVFRGEVDIHITINSAVDSIEFHLNRTQLEITSLFLDTKKVNCLEPCTMKFDDLGYVYSRFEMVKILRADRQAFVPGSHIIHMKYNGKLSTTTNGIFKASFTKNNTILNYLLATDLQPSWARQVFPSFDEPAFKAKFQVNLVVPNNSFEALSNMRVLQTYPTSDGILYKFETTPVMSTYLLSFAVLKKGFSKSYIDDSGVDFKIYSFEESGRNDTRLLEFASKTLKFYAEYTNFSYILPKLDFIGFDRYDSSATENWGLITFNTSLLSCDDDVYDISQKQSTIAHELAHSWFGNLVTNDWWDDIWLHEGFATFMSMKAEDAVLNNNASRHFPVTYLENLFHTEQTRSETAVVTYHENPSEIDKNFNDITYIKGCAVMRMIELIIGEQTLNDVLIKFIQTYAFKTATTHEFLQIIEEYSSENVREFAETYLYQTQFPLIYVDEDDDNFVIKQTVYKLKPQNNVHSVFNYRWTIPVTYTTNLNSSWSLAWFYKDMDALIIPKNNATWIKLNYNHIGYYRVNYNLKLWEILIERNNEFEIYDRDHFLLNAIGLFEIDVISCDIALRYIRELSNVTKNPRFNMEIASLTYIRINYAVRSHKEAFLQLKKFFGYIFKRIGRKQLAKSFLSGVVDNGETSSEDNQNNKHPTRQSEACINWLLNKSSEYNLDFVDSQVQPVIIQE